MQPQPRGQDEVLAGRFVVRGLLKEAQGVRTLVAKDLENGADVVVKAAPLSKLAPAALMRMEHEAFVLRRLDGEHFAPLVDFGRDGDVLYLVMSYVRGPTLEERLGKGSLSTSDAVSVGRCLLAALRDIHEHGVLHGDVKPSNLIVDQRHSPLEATLVDLGLARSRWLDPSLRDLPAGTVRYMSPEQAGILDREVDERSDLYSAGAVLFECLVGRPLFEGSTLGEVLREHATAGSADPRAFASVPRAVAELVMRLLAKDPSDRYQSADAVLGDLADVAASLDRGENEPAVVIGLHDSRRSLAEPAFVGRETELGILDAQLDRAGRGGGGLVLLESESGGGKTRLLEEFTRGNVGRGTWILDGLGVDQAAQRPFEVLAGVVASVLHEVRSNTVLERILRERVGERSDAVCAAFPELRGIFGQPPLEGGPGPEAFGEQRTLDALAVLLSALGTETNPAVVLLDDCQWADELTLKLLVHWQRNGRDDSTHTMVVAAFRSEEVGSDDPLRRVEASASIELPPLEVADIRSLAESMAGPLPAEALDVIVHLSQGSPFMASAVVRGLVETGALVEVESGWSVDAEALADAKASRRAAAFLARRLSLLPDTTLRLLQVGAVLGKQFEADFAGHLAGCTPFDTRIALEEAHRRHIVWARNGTWTFVHDKLRQTVLELLEDDVRRDLHTRAAHRLEERYPDRAFDLAYHFDAAGSSERALPYALTAAEQARAQYALDIAQQQYEIADRGAHGAGPRTSLRITEGLGDVLILRGVYDAAATQLHRARNLAEDGVTRARVDSKLGDLAFKRGDIEAAREALERGIRSLGRRIPRYFVTFLLAATVEIAVQLAHMALPKLLCARRQVKGAEAEFVAIRLYSRLAHVYWFAKGTIPTFWTHLRELNLAERYPPTPELAQAYSEHAPAMSLIPYYKRGVRYGLRSLEIRRELGDLWGQGQSLHFMGVLSYCSSRFEEAIERCREAVRLLARTGDRWEVNVAEENIALALYRLGDLRGAVDVARRVYRNGAEIGDALARGVSLDAWSKASAGRAPRDLIAADLERPTYDVQVKAELMQAEAVRLLTEGEPDKAVEVLERAYKAVTDQGLRQEYVAPILPWLATAIRTQAERVPVWDTRGRRRLLRRGRSVARRARMVAFFFRNNRAHALRESGWLEAMSGRRHRARRFFERSRLAAEGYGMRYERVQTLEAMSMLGPRLGWPSVVEPVAPDEVLRSLDGTFEESPAVTPSLIDRFDTVLDTGRNVASALTRDAVYAATREAALALLRAERCVVAEVPQDGEDDFHTVAGHTLTEFSRTLARRALAVGRPVLLEEEATDASESVVLAGVRSALCAPIFVRGKVAACLYAEHRKLAGLFGPDEERLAAFVATVAGAALENAEGFAEIQDLTRTLERRVRERTKELGETNQRLDQSLRDLTDAYEREREMTEQLKRLDQLKTDFMAMTAHDLRTPLTSIAGFASLLAEEWPGLTDDDRRGMVDHITTAASRLGEFIENMLQFARIESGELSYDIKPFDLAALVEKVVRENGGATPERFTTSIADEVPLALGDEQRNWQVLTNLLSNAVKFSPPGSPVEVAVVRSDDMLKVSVTDEGPGIAAEDQARLFKKFRRVTGAGTKLVPGTGLGLYICKSIVEAQGGTIWVESDPGHGATFAYTLPVR